MSARTIPSREQTDEAYDAVRAESSRILSEPVPFAALDAKYRIGKTLVFAMVEHRENDAGTALLLSIDGYWSHAKWYPLRQIQVFRSKVERRFMVVTMPGRLANEKELPTQAVRPRLTARIAWSDEAQAEWRNTTSHRIRINDAIKLKNRNYSKLPQRLRFGETA